MTGFDELFDRLQYRSWLQNFMTECSEASDTRVNVGQRIEDSQASELIQSKHLYTSEQIESELVESSLSCTIHQISGKIGGLLSFRGQLCIPARPAKALVTVAHGMASLPELVTGVSGHDYHNKIGQKLAAAGFIVWTPFFPHGGNVPSIIEISARLGRIGLSHTAYVISSYSSVQAILLKLGVQSPKKSAIYGISVGAMNLLHAATVLDFDARVISGYLRNDNLLQFDLPSLILQGGIMPISFNPHAARYYMPECFNHLNPRPTFFEVGENDPLNSAELHRDQVFRNAQEAWPDLEEHNLVKYVFNGSHEVEAYAAINWLIRVLGDS